MFDGVGTSDYFMEPTSITASEYLQTVQWYMDMGLTVIVLGVLRSPPFRIDKWKAQMEKVSLYQV
jgi:hypothetical protein